MIRAGLAGLGRMGAPMAANIAEAGFPLLLWNRSGDKAEAVARSIGATVVATPRDLAAGSDVVITMLADDRASADVHLGADGVLSAEGGAATVLVMGTHSPAHVDTLVEASGGRTIVDAPVSGSTAAAEAGALLVMAGAAEATIAPIRSVLSAVAGEIVCLGRTGAGATMKLAVNMLIHGLNQTVSEAIDLAEAAGIEAEDAYAVIERSAAAAPMLGYRKGQYLDEAANPVSFALTLAGKDVDLALRLAASVQVELPQAELNLAQLRSAEAAGFGDRDMASMLNYRRSLR